MDDNDAGDNDDNRWWWRTQSGDKTSHDPASSHNTQFKGKKSYVKYNKESQLAIAESGAKHHNYNPPPGNKY